MKKILIIPDVHGRQFWQTAMYFKDDYEKIIFLGDYLDPYWEERIFMEDAFVEFLKILDLKRDNPDKVILLMGNHDLHYLWSHDMNCSRRDENHLEFLNAIFVHHRNLFQMAYEYKSDKTTYLFTHAGILKGWLQNNCATYSEQWLNEMLNQVSFGILKQVNNVRGGNDSYGSPIWADLLEHEIATPLEGYYQIFGHSLDEEPTIKEHWACLDCKRAFELNLETGEIT